LKFIYNKQFLATYIATCRVVYSKRWHCNRK